MSLKVKIFARQIVFRLKRIQIIHEKTIIGQDKMANTKIQSCQSEIVATTDFLKICFVDNQPFPPV